MSLTFMTRTLCLVLLCLGLFSGQSSQAAAVECGALTHIPVLHEGRLKPFDSMARSVLKNLSGREYTDELKACDWLAQTIFDPAKTLDTPVFQIRNKDLKTYLGISETQNLFSYNALAGPLSNTIKQIPVLLNKDESALTQEQRDLLMLHDDVALLHDFMRSFSLVFPLELDLPQNIQSRIPENATINYLSLQPLMKEARDSLVQVVKAKGENIEAYTDEEQSLATFVFYIDQLQTGGRASEMLRIVPADLAQKDLWVSPWMMIEQGHGTPSNGLYLEIWRDMAAAYSAENQNEFDALVKSALTHIQSMTSQDYTAGRFHVEFLYNAYKPYDWMLGLYGLSILLALIGIYARNSAFHKAALATLCLSVLTHISAIAARIYILDRPPVGTLYESLLFVSLICAVIGLILYLKKQEVSGLITGAGTAFLLLCFAPFILQDGESLDVLVAVLNTNFWLGTHVLCITIGYGVCLIAGSLAHIALAQNAFSKKPNTKSLEDLIYKSTIYGLFFTAIGTILGGIWADQSWGRFWGWDPKENGALLIVLWLIWLQHGRLSGHLNQTGFLVTVCLLNIIVALAWFGVNLLGVGLHSYGFISGIGISLALFCGIECVIILSLWIANLKQRRSHFS